MAGRMGAGVSPHLSGPVLDHAFVLVRPWRAGQSGRDAAEEIVDGFERSGFRPSPGRRHPGQGTENRPFRFRGLMLELLFVVDRDEAAAARTAPLALLPRLDDVENSPFGIASRPADSAFPDAPWPCQDYRPAYLPEATAIRIACDVPPAEPLWFHLPFVMPDGEPAARATIPDHPNAVDSLQSVSLVAPTAFGRASTAIAGVLGVALEHDPSRSHGVTLRFGDGAQGRSIVPHPQLPLTILV